MRHRRGKDAECVNENKQRRFETSANFLTFHTQETTQFVTPAISLRSLDRLRAEEERFARGSPTWIHLRRNRVSPGVSGLTISLFQRDFTRRVHRSIFSLASSSVSRGRCSFRAESRSPTTSPIVRSCVHACVYEYACWFNTVDDLLR